VVSRIRNLEKQERESFALLSSALRDSHEKERARTEKTKYWSIIGSIIGAIIGITGSTINNYMKMKEMRSIVGRASENSEDLRKLSIQLCDSVRNQSQKMDGLLVDLHTTLAKGDESPKAAAPLDKIRFSATADDIHKQTERILGALKSQEQNFDAEIREIRNLLGIEHSQKYGGGEGEMVVYVGPEMKSMMLETEQNLERKIKYSALASATFVYTALALTLPIVFSYFGGGS
jgi:hypothetical protein